MLCKVAKCRRTQLVGYEPESSDLRWGGPGLRIFLALISGTAARNTSHHSTLAGVLPRLVSCCSPGRGRARAILRVHCRELRTVLLPGFRGRVAPGSASGHPRSWSTAARSSPRSGTAPQACLWGAHIGFRGFASSIAGKLGRHRIEFNMYAGQPGSATSWDSQCHMWANESSRMIYFFKQFVCQWLQI